MDLVQKLAIFATFFFLSNIGQENVFSRLKKTRSSKCRKIDIFQKGLSYGFGLKKRPFFQLFWGGHIRQVNVFYDILEQKNAFLGYKNKKFKKSKN